MEMAFKATFIYSTKLLWHPISFHHLLSWNQLCLIYFIHLVMCSGQKLYARHYVLGTKESLMLFLSSIYFLSSSFSFSGKHCFLSSCSYGWSKHDPILWLWKQSIIPGHGNLFRSGCVLIHITENQTGEFFFWNYEERNISFWES